MRILVTGFEPWGEFRRNPSGEAARALGGHVLPVRYAEAGRGIARLIRETRPEAILMLGLAPGRRKITIEAVARNVDSYAGPGPWKRRRRRIMKGPLERESRLPAARILRRLKTAGFPAGLSRDAGTFICNHVFYVALARSRVPCGFVHVPPEEAVSPARLVRAVRLILDGIAGRPGRAVRVV